MPFTLAHPAAVLPFRRFLIFSALIVGSVAPDFHYFFFMGPRGHFSHSIEGAFLFCLPISLALLWLFQTVMKVPLISLAPRSQQPKLVRFAAPFRWRPGSRFALILVSLMVGIGTHLGWDSLTHEHGLFVRNFPDLRAPTMDELGRERPLYDVLQNTSTVMGMAVLVLWYARWVRRAPAQPVPEYLRMSSTTRICLSATIVLGSAAASVAYGYIYTGGWKYLRILAGIAVITFMSTVFTGAAVYGALWHWKRKTLRDRAIGPISEIPKRSEGAL